MKMQVQKASDTAIAFVALPLLIIGWLIEPNRDLAFTIWSSLAILYGLFVMCHTIMLRRFLLGTFHLFIFYSVAAVWLLNFMLNVPMSSWRDGWERSGAFIPTLQTCLVYLTFFSMTVAAAVAYLPKVKISPLLPLPRHWETPIFLLSLASSLIFVAVAGVTNRDAFIGSADIGSSFLIQTSSVLIAVLFGLALFLLPSGPGRRATLGVLVVAGLIVGANGFRFILVIMALMLWMYTLTVRKMPNHRVVVFLIGGILTYLFLLAAAYSRSEGMLFLDLIVNIATLRFPWDQALAFTGAAEQMNFVAFDYYLKNSPMLMGQSYGEAFIRLAPNAVHTAFFENAMRSQDFIMSTGNFIPDNFRDSGLTIGAHLWIEGIINFGRLGPYIVSIVFVAIYALFEYVSRQRRIYFVPFIYLAASSFSLAWYGFANTLKAGAFALFSAYIIWFICRATAKTTGGHIPLLARDSQRNRGKQHRLR